MYVQTHMFNKLHNGRHRKTHTILTFNLYRAGLRIRNQWDPYDFSASIKTKNPDRGYDLVSVNLI